MSRSLYPLFLILLIFTFCCSRQPLPKYPHCLRSEECRQGELCVSQLCTSNIESPPPPDYPSETIKETPNTQNEIFTKLTGTAFAISDDGLIVTACHLVQDAPSMKIHLHDGSIAEASIHKKDPSNDIAILKIETQTPFYLPIAPLKSSKTGDRVFTLGFPINSLLGQEAKYTEGVISSLSGIKDTQSLFQITVPIQPGNSGGPLVNEDGFVVGIISSSAAILPFLKDTGTLPQNINWAVKADYLRLLIEIPIPTSTEDNRGAIIERAKNSTFLIEVVNSK